ncbi:hypothetical protein [Streptomyces adelaidensis]|uniref:hypothetical protein n=1 Tax=Streptomyces adelaidensis TaxID=2796465 RepID=UPI00190719AC|nr:hypothetical protein [Streptomyces adelaidensis]
MMFEKDEARKAVLLRGAQIGRDEREARDPGGQGAPGEEEVEARSHRPPGGEADAQDHDEVDGEDRVVEPVGGEPKLGGEVLHAQLASVGRFWCSLFGCDGDGRGNLCFDVFGSV